MRIFTLDAKLKLYYIISHHITSHHITSHHITSHHITSHHITLHYIRGSETNNHQATVVVQHFAYQD